MISSFSQAFLFIYFVFFGTHMYIPEPGCLYTFIYKRIEQIKLKSLH